MKLDSKYQRVVIYIESFHISTRISNQHLAENLLLIFKMGKGDVEHANLTVYPSFVLRNLNCPIKTLLLFLLIKSTFL